MGVCAFLLKVVARFIVRKRYVVFDLVLKAMGKQRVSDLAENKQLLLTTDGWNAWLVLRLPLDLGSSTRRFVSILTVDMMKYRSMYSAA